MERRPALPQAQGLRTLASGVRALFWPVFVSAGGTALLVLSHFSMAGAGGQVRAEMAASQRAGMAGLVVLTLMLSVWGLVGVHFPRQRTRMVQMAGWGACLAFSGIPLLYTAALASTVFGALNYWRIADFGTILGLVAWVRLLSLGLRR